MDTDSCVSVKIIVARYNALFLEVYPCLYSPCSIQHLNVYLKLPETWHASDLFPQHACIAFLPKLIESSKHSCIPSSLSRGYGTVITETIERSIQLIPTFIAKAYSKSSRGSCLKEIVLRTSSSSSSQISFSIGASRSSFNMALVTSPEMVIRKWICAATLQSLCQKFLERGRLQWYHVPLYLICSCRRSTLRPAPYS